MDGQRIKNFTADDPVRPHRWLKENSPAAGKGAAPPKAAACASAASASQPASAALRTAASGKRWRRNRIKVGFLAPPPHTITSRGRFRKIQSYWNKQRFGPQMRLLPSPRRLPESVPPNAPFSPQTPYGHGLWGGLSAIYL